tara:strand:- start:222 stop:659 length:438 start_codon:yes stop_codon:yes gene_type:complete
MSTDDISEVWAQDSPIDETNLVGEFKNIPKLHSKYYNIYFKEVLRVKKHKAEYRELERLKREYYDGSMAEETLKQYGWKPFQLKVLRNDLDRYVQSDKDIIAKSLVIDYHSARSNFLEDIVKSIHSRNFIIKGMLDVLKFQAGEY